MTSLRTDQKVVSIGALLIRLVIALINSRKVAGRHTMVLGKTFCAVRIVHIPHVAIFGL
jgi:hypothetical protein